MEGLEIIRDVMRGRIEIRGDCWIFTGSKNARGYGFISHKGKTVSVLTLAYSLINGPIDKGFIISPQCKNKCCVNPNHLRKLTRHDLEMEKILEGKDGVKLTEELVIAFVEDFLSSREPVTAIAKRHEISPKRAYSILYEESWTDATSSYSNDLQKAVQSIRNRNIVITDAQVKKIREEYTGNNLSHLAQKYGTSPQYIWRIATGNARN